MLKRFRLLVMLVLTIMIFGPHAFGATGALFNVSASGTKTPQPISITLCLNASGPLSCQNYYVSALTLSILTTIPHHRYNNIGIKINTPGYTVTSGSSPCSLNNKGYCSLVVSETSPATLQVRPNTYAYIVNSPVNPPFSISICPVSSDGSQFGSCQITNAPDSTLMSTLNYPFAIALNPAQTIAYIANAPSNNGSIAICPIKSNGLFDTCTTSTDASFTDAAVSGVAFSPDGSYLYASVYSNDLNCTTESTGCGWVSICPVNANGSLGACTISHGNNVFNVIDFWYTQFVGVQTAANGNPYLYTNANQMQVQVTFCPVTNGIIGECKNTTTDEALFQTPQGISFNAANTYSYIANASSNSVFVCQVNSNGELPGNDINDLPPCTSSLGPDASNASTFNFNGENGAGLFMSSATGYGYIPNNGKVMNVNVNTVSICPISSTDGSLSFCVATTGNDSSGANTFNQPVAITLKLNVG